MNKYVDLLTNKIAELCKLYESYAWKKNNRKLGVVFQANMSISFFLYDDKELIDNIQITFPKQELDLYRVICLRIFAILLGNVEIHNKDNIYYNDVHKKYLGIIVGDRHLKDDIDKMVHLQYQDSVNFDNQIIVAATKKLKSKVYSKKVINDMETRIELLRTFLRG